MKASPTYVRPMGAWWRRNGFYRAYMLREASALFVTLYAVVLLVGLARLAQGPAAYDAWCVSLATPASIAFHVVVLLFVAYHAWTWIAVMPKTMPFVRIGGRRVGDRTLVALGAAASIGAQVALVALLAWLGWAR
jgi:fumarate reductase subunit C